MEEVGKMGSHIQRVIKGQHKHVSGKYGNIIPHEMLLQRRGRRKTGLVDYFTHPSNDLEMK